MVDIKIGGPAGVGGPDRKKPAAKTGSASGPTFASLLEETAETAETAAAAPLPQGYIPVEAEEGQPRPRKGRQQAQDLISGLTELAEDVLSGQAGNAAARLEAYLKNEVADRADLSPEAQQALDELSTRAAVAAEKAKS
jgi:hypothetical protein